MTTVSLPAPEPAARAHSERLQAFIKQQIRGHGGAIAFSRYMELALYAPGLGYYSAGARKFGAEGDFVTSPELGPTFAECVAQAVAPVFAQLAGAEKTFFELGGGSGAFAEAALRHCAALGADEIVAIGADPGALDHHVVANILAAYIRSSGGADLVLCGRQASDDDQGVVPILLAESLGLPVAPLARAVELAGERLRVTRVTPDGDEVLEGALPAVVTVSNELGEPRFPGARDKMAARKKQVVEVAAADLGLGDEQLTPRVVLAKQYVPEVHGHCEFIEGTPAEAAAQLLEKLRADKLI